MNKKSLVEKIKQKFREDEIRRRDPRFLHTMAFLVAKGFLKTNYDLRPLPSAHIKLDDAIWAGENVEPRILEVLPAAVLRLGRHFDLNRHKHPSLFRVVEQLRRQEAHGNDFCGMPYQKIKVWADFPLADRRIKANREKKIVKTFRLDPEVVIRLKTAAEKLGFTETELIESLVRGLSLSSVGSKKKET